MTNPGSEEATSTKLDSNAVQRLRAAREKVEKINIGPNGEVRAEPANIE